MPLVAVPAAVGLVAVVVAAVEGTAVPLVPSVLAAVVAAGASWVGRADAGGALVLTGKSDVVRVLPAACRDTSDQIERGWAMQYPQHT